MKYTKKSEIIHIKVNTQKTIKGKLTESINQSIIVFEHYG